MSETKNSCVADVSLEMSTADLARRQNQTETGVSVKDQRDAQTTDSEYRELVNKTHEGAVPGRMVYLRDESGLTPARLRQLIKSVKRQVRQDHGTDKQLRFVVVDHLHLMSPDNDRLIGELAWADITKKLKSIAKGEQVVLMVPAQLNRASETEKREPMLRDLRGSGAIEQDADTVLLIHRPDNATEAKFLLEKARHAAMGSVKAVWKGSRTVFEPLDHDDQFKPKGVFHNEIN